MASFQIQTDKSHYLAGETIRGKVLLHVASNISNTQGVSLRFVGRQSLRWREKRPIDAETLVGSNTNLIPTERSQKNCNHEVYRTDELDISDCQTQDNGKDRLQPRIIKTADNSYFQLQYRDKRNEFAIANVKLLPPGQIASGQYSFPFSIPTQQEWPGSSSQKLNNTASQLRYLLTVTLQPYNPRYHFRQRKEIFITEDLDSDGCERFQEQVSSFYCLKKGRTEYEITLKKGSFSPGEEGQIIISIDNAECSADVEGVSLVFVHTLTQKKGDAPVKTETELETKQISCLVKGGQSAKFASAIRQSFKVPDVPATSRGSLTSSELSIKVNLKHAATFYTNSIVGIPEKLSSLPQEFTKGWKPREMQPVTLQPSNLFKRTNSMGKGEEQK